MESRSLLESSPHIADQGLMDYLKHHFTSEQIIAITKSLEFGMIPTLTQVPDQRIYIQVLPSKKHFENIGYIAIIYGNQISEFHENSSSGLLYFVNAYKRAISRLPHGHVFIFSDFISMEKSIKGLFSSIPSLLSDFEQRASNFFHWLDRNSIVPFVLTPMNIARFFGVTPPPSDIELYEIIDVMELENSLSIIRNLIVRKAKYYDWVLNSLVRC